MIFENSSWHKSTIIRSVQKRTSIGCLLEILQPREGGFKTASERLNDRVPSNQAGSKPSRARDCKPSIFSRSLLPYTSGMLRKSKQKLRSDALAMMGEAGMFQGFVISKLNNLPHVKTWPRTHRRELREMKIGGFQGQHTRMAEEEKEERTTLRSTRKREEEETLKREMTHCNPIKLNLSLLRAKKLGDLCEMYKTLARCYNYRKAGHDGHHCRRRGCLKCNGRHHTSICENTPSYNSRQIQ